MATLVERAIGAARLDPATYEEVEADTNALGQAMVVVVVAGIASGIGSAVASGAHFGMVRGAIGAVIGWFVWALTIYLVGTRLLPMPETKADLGELLRTIGFASAPGVVGILGLLPIVGGLAMLVAWLWQLAAMVVAVRQALDYTSTGRALAVCAIGLAAQLLVMFLFLSVLFGSAAMLGSALQH